MLSRTTIASLLLVCSLLMAADPPKEQSPPLATKPLTDADKLKVSKQMNQVLALNGQLGQIAEQYKKLEAQAQSLQANFQTIMADMRKKYGASELQQINLDLEWTEPPPTGKPPEAGSKK